MVIKTKPVPFDEIAFERDWSLLVLSREHQASGFRLDPVENSPVLSLGVEHISGTTLENFIAADPNFAILKRNRRQIEVMPPVQLQQVAGQIVLVEALHHDHERTSLL